MKSLSSATLNATFFRGYDFGNKKEGKIVLNYVRKAVSKDASAKNVSHE